MHILEKNDSRICCCDNANTERIFNRTFYNNAFSIYGVIMNGRKILIRYHGILCKKNIESTKGNNNLYLYYCFNSNWIEKEIVNMNLCNHNTQTSQAYCTIIDIPDAVSISSLNIAFTDDNEDWDTDVSSTYTLNICHDIEKEIMERYNLKSAPPAILNNSLSTIECMKKSYQDFIKQLYNFFKFNKPAS